MNALYIAFRFKGVATMTEYKKNIEFDENIKYSTDKDISKQFSEFYNKHKKSVIIAGALTLASSGYFAAGYVDVHPIFETDEIKFTDKHSYEEKQILKGIRKNSREMISRTVEHCGPTIPDTMFGDDAREGAGRALTLISKAYPELSEKSEIFKFLDDNGIKPHLTSGGIIDTPIVLYNKASNDDRTLILKGGIINSETDSKAIRTLIDKMMDNEILEQDAVYITFNNKSSQIKPNYDIKKLDYTNDLPNSFPTFADAPNFSQTLISPLVWKNPCVK